MTISQTNGLHIKCLPTGDIVQELTQTRMKTRLSLLKPGQNGNEIKRAITLDGTVIRYFKNKTQLLFSNGNIAELICGVWIITNNKGLRMTKDNKGNVKQIESIPCVSVTDPETKIRTIFREDSVKIIIFTDGSQITEHQDGTKVFISSDKSEILIESPGYAPVSLYNQDGNKEYEINMPDESVVRGKTNDFWETVFYSSTSAVVLANSNSEV